jgi:cell division protein FtsB
MVERRRLDIRGALVSAGLSALVTLLVMLVSFSGTFGRMSERVDRITQDVARLVAMSDVAQDQYAELCQRIASLEAQMKTLLLERGTS